MAKKFILLEEMWKNLRKERFNTWTDKLGFIQILFIWIGGIVSFGLFYYLFIGESSFLFSNLNKEPAEGLLNYVYFSFITATSTGFGDIVPLGYFKIIAIFEVIFGLILLALVTSKLVSIKQDVILGEIYEISFNERINRLRSSLLLFRQSLNKMINKIEENYAKKRDINEIYVYFSPLEDILKEISTLLNKKGRNNFTKVIDPVDMELIINSVTSSFKKINELIMMMEEKKFEWKRDVTLSLLNKCLALDKEIFDKLEASRILSEQIFKGLKESNNKVTELIKGEMKPAEEEKKLIESLGEKN